MSRFVIRWDPENRSWEIDDQRFGVSVASFPTLLEAEEYVIERSERSER